MSPAFREGLKITLPLGVLLLGTTLLPASWAFIPSCFLFALFAFSLYFFRDPERPVPVDPDILVSPADGKVVAIEEIENSPFGLGRRKRIAIFLSVFDVHVNRMPWTGSIEKIQHVPGKFLDVRDPRCTLENEHANWLIQTSRGPLIVRQIAGLIARRIVLWKSIGSTVDRGDRIGMIRFGSRTELYLPLDAEILVSVGDTAYGNSTPVARWKPTASSNP